VLGRLRDAAALREGLGLGGVSHRMVFGEADRLPGLIVDRYTVQARGGLAQVFVVQAHTAGMDRALSWVIEGLEEIAPRAGLLVRNDVGVRKLEGLEQQGLRVVRDVSGVDLDAARLVMAGAVSSTVEFFADLKEGQKTGFFLDQALNVRHAVELFRNLRPGTNQGSGKALRILDLCCYVGQWSTQLARAFKNAGVEVEVVGVDASEKALAFAAKNVSAQGARFEAMKGDVLKDLASLKDRSFDLVISDPPAFIKGRKDLPTGTHAYLQLNTQVFRLVREGGAVVCCSCSSLLEESAFVETLAKAARRNLRLAQWVGRGGQAPDHPVLAEFPEGRYLKAWFGTVR
jgi:23S rRNA (cytosine1962-C5)-methyltransferase